jgi:hypothetical protein
MVEVAVLWTQRPDRRIGERQRHVAQINASPHVHNATACVDRTFTTQRP